jgi:fumarylacetoacetase
MKSWVASANAPDSDFPLNNLPYGVFSTGDDTMPRCGVAIGDMIFDLCRAEGDGLLGDLAPVFDVPYWNDFMDLGPDAWASLRATLIELLKEGAAERPEYLVAQADVQMLMPFQVAEYTDFYAGKNHAFNVGSIFRGPENALPPNWLSIPIGYNGRASSVVVSGTDVRRPWGQLTAPAPSGSEAGAQQTADLPVFAPCKRFDLELEMGAIVGQPSEGPVTVQEADDMIFGYVLLNDWSARDIQAWEYQPLGPFQAKATATTISPWIVTKAALEPFRTSTPKRERALLPYLQEPGPMIYDVDLEVALAPDGGGETVLSRTNFKELYYSAAQQLAHHTTSGCAMRVGDLLGSGTISGTEKDSRGSLLELSWSGQEPVTLTGGATRSFLEDGDTLTLRGAAKGDGYRVGFGDCAGKVVPALDDPYKR